MLLCFRVQEGNKDGLVTGSEEGKGHGTSQAV
jgi:hypothetical protein